MRSLYIYCSARRLTNAHQARANVIDATRVSDDKLVYLKKIHPDSEELQLLRYLSSPEMLQDPHNHCVPLLDVIHDLSDPQTCFVAMPYLRYIDYPHPEFVEDMLEYGEQILEVGVTVPAFDSALSFMSLHRDWSSCTTTAWPISESMVHRRAM